MQETQQDVGVSRGGHLPLHLHRRPTHPRLRQPSPPGKTPWRWGGMRGGYGSLHRVERPPAREQPSHQLQQPWGLLEG